MWTDHISDEQYQALKERVGEAHLKKRLSREAEHNILQIGEFGFQINWESMPWLFETLKFFLKATGLFNRGARNAVNYEVVRQDVSFDNLPESFKGYRILHLSDIHLDIIPDRAQKLKEALSQLEYDLCVMTGDFRFGTVGPFSIMMRRVEDLMSVLNCPDGVYGILGNHDFIEMVPGFEAAGMKMLLNEVTTIERGGNSIQIAGVDDAHFYEVSDIEMVGYESETSLFRLFLSHSLELIPRAAEFYFDYYLCGHTHGGQICLPGGIPIITNTGLHKKYIKGPWTCGKMKGYTSRGIGTSGLNVRYFCRPEIVLHTLS